MMEEVIILLVLVAVVLFLFIGSIFPIYYFVQRRKETLY